MECRLFALLRGAAECRGFLDPRDRLNFGGAWPLVCAGGTPFIVAMLAKFAIYERLEKREIFCVFADGLFV